MSASHSTTATVPGKPAKPRPDFPLTYHRAGYWCKKILGKIHYFGPRFDPADPAAATAAADAALADYNQKADALHAGRKPREDTGGLTIKAMVNAFLIAKAAARDAGEITPRSWGDYKAACDLLIKHLGKARLVADLGPDDFADLRTKMSRNWSPGTLGNAINRMRVVFKYASDNGLMDRPVCYGASFKRPTKKTMRIERAKKGRKLFSATEIHKLLKEAGPAMRAMIMLGINCGFGNSDCGGLPMSALDQDAAMIDFPRPKTGIPRRCPLWPETVSALREALANRPNPKKAEHAELVFITKYGDRWAKDTKDNPVTKELAKLLRQLGINGRTGLGFYTLRHTFRTVADESKDPPAVDFIMGHEVPHMSAVDRESISDDRLRSVADHVRRWLWPAPAALPQDLAGEEE